MADGSDQPKTFTADQLRLKRHTAAVRMILTLLQNDADNQADHPLYSINLGRDLSEQERIVLMWVLMGTFHPDMLENIASTWFENVGMPSVALMEDPTSDARFWASDATAKELSVYAAACFNKMSPKRKAEFAKWIKGKVGD